MKYLEEAILLMVQGNKGITFQPESRDISNFSNNPKNMSKPCPPQTKIIPTISSRKYAPKKQKLLSP